MWVIVTLSVDICTAASHYTFKKLFRIGITIVIQTSTSNVSLFLFCLLLYMDVAPLKCREHRVGSDFVLKWAKCLLRIDSNRFCFSTRGPCVEL